MRAEYDFSQSVPNPYAQKVKRQVTIGLNEDIVEYLQRLADETNVPYEKLVNLCLRDCIQSQQKLTLE